MSESYIWHFTKLKPETVYEDWLIDELFSVHCDGFGMEYGWNMLEIQETLKTSTILGLLKSKDSKEKKIHGFGIYSVSDYAHEGGHVLWGNALVLRDGLQKGRLIFGLLELVMSMFPDKPFRWIGARTQNPSIYRRYIKYAETFFPFDEDFSTVRGKELVDFVSINIPQLADSIDNHPIPENGICRGIYGRKFGNYYVNPDDPLIDKYERYLTDHKFDRDAGDGVVVIAERGIGLGYRIKA